MSAPPFLTSYCPPCIPRSSACGEQPLSLIYPVECKGRFQTHSDRMILGKVHIKQLFLIIFINNALLFLFWIMPNLYVNNFELSTTLVN